MPEPKEYAEGWTEFLKCKIDLAKRPLIPRPETEFWTQKCLEQIEARPDPNVLDLFAGSGCVGIAVATHCPKAKVTLADVKNYVTTPLPKNATFVLSDLFEGLTGKFEFILANPPYVPLGKGTRGIMDHEPPEALYAGKDGLALIKPFIEQAPSYLKPGGQIWMEFGSPQKGDITALLREYNYYQGFNCSFHKDQYGNYRYLTACATIEG